MAQFSICQALLALTCARSHRFYRGDLKRMQAVVFADRHIISNNEAVRAEMIACPCSKTYPAQKPVDEDVTLLAFDLLACIIAIRVDAAPLFSALLTLWLSMTQAVGLASRPIASRHFTYNAW